LSTTENIPTDDEEVKSADERIRRTKLTIARENKQILDYIVKGVTHQDIMKWVGLNEKNYWKRIAAIRKRDMELTKAEQTPEAHAFLYKRTEEKFHNLESMTMQIIESKTEQARDRIEAMKFLRQLYLDQYSLFLYGPSQFLTRDAKGDQVRPICYNSNNNNANFLNSSFARARVIEGEEKDRDYNAVF
jgi:hypothetical protein